MFKSSIQKKTQKHKKSKILKYNLRSALMMSTNHMLLQMVFTFETSATNRTSERFSRGMHGHVAPQMMFSLKSFSTYVTLGAFFGRSMGHFHVKLVTVGRNEVFSTFLTNSTHALILNDCHMMKERFFINKPATAIPARHSLKRQRRLRSIMN